MTIPLKTRPLVAARYERIAWSRGFIAVFAFWRWEIQLAICRRCKNGWTL